MLSPQVDRRLTVVSRRLLALGFVPVGPCSLAGWDGGRAYSFGGLVVYLAWTADGRWTVLAPICDGHETEAVFEALEQFVSA